MNASSIQAPTPAVLMQIDQALQSGEVDNGPVFMFDAERSLFVFVQVVDGQVHTWRVEHCPSVEVFRARVDANIVAARLLATQAEVDAPPLH